MNIEDVKQISDWELDEALCKLIGVSRIGAKEAQAKAIESADMDYLQNLQLAIWGNIRNDIPTYRIVGMLQASPRQIAMAAYITLQEVQGNE